VNIDWSFAMHNCSETKERITELLLDEADCRSDEALAAELRGCAECRDEFNALRATLRLTMKLRETTAPSESYWIHYHTKLRRSIKDSAKQSHARTQRRKEEALDFLAPLRLCVKTSIAVPLPLMVAVILAFVMLGLFSISATRRSPTHNPVIVSVPVEVPVIQEKIVTRVVYRDRRPSMRTAKRPINTAPKVDDTFAKSRDIPAILAGFKPTEEVKLTVIKGRSANEK
jgi:hypothetical protein